MGMLRFLKYYFIIIIIVPSFCNAQLRGQEINQPEYDNEQLHMGINFGFNRSHFNILHSAKFIQFDSINVIESINNTGLNLAWSVDLRLGNHFSLRTHPVDVTYTEKAFEYILKTPDRLKLEDSITKKKVEGISLGLPIQLKFASDRIKNFKVYMMAGIKFDYDLAANTGKKNNDEVITFKRLDIAAEAGIGFHFYLPYFVLTPELKITNGLRNILSKTESLKYANTIENILARTITFSLTFE
jgi:Outer membrane protein beta-barrel domain